MDDVSPDFATTTEFDDSLEGDGQKLTINHRSGATVDTEFLNITVNGAESDQGDAAEYVGNVFEEPAGDTFGAGNSVTIDRTHFEDSSGDALDTTGDNLVLEEADVLVIWEDPDPDHERADVVYRCEPEFPDCKGL